MRALLVVLLAGCGGGDPCDAFPDETCLSLEVRGPGLSIDQVALHALSGFTLSDGRSPKIVSSAFSLPVRLAVVPGGKFAGAVELEVRGFLAGLVVGADQIHSTVAAGQHLGVIAELGGKNQSDLAGVDFSGLPDLARSQNDLAAQPGSDLSVSTGEFVSEVSGESNTALMGVFGRGNDVWAVALGGDIIHSSGDGTWTKQRTGAGGIDETLFGVTELNGNLFAFGGQGKSGSGFQPLLLRSTNGTTWSAVSFPGTDTNFSMEIHGMGSVGATDFWAGLSASSQASLRGALHSPDLVNWTKEATTATPDIQAPTGMFVASAVAQYLVDGRIWRSIGNGSWSLQTLPPIDTPFLDAVHGSSDVDIWAVGTFGPFGMEKPLVLHSVGNNTWTQESLPTTDGSNLEAVFAVSSNDVWAVGDSSVILNFTTLGGGIWSGFPSGTTQNLHGVYANGTDVYAVGEKGTIVHMKR